MEKARVCFVCLGNICRSPTAEGLFRKEVDLAGMQARVFIDSAGTGDWHVGQLPDARTRAVAISRGVRLESRARQFCAEDFTRFDFLVAMDRDNRRNMLRLAETPEQQAKVHLFRDFIKGEPKGLDVPDPYYGGDDGFEEVFAICEAGAKGLLEHLGTWFDAHGAR